MPSHVYRGEITMPDHIRITRNRREFLRNACGGFGGLAFGAMLHQEQLRAQSANPLAPKKPHIPAKAKSVIFLFLSGGPNHMETFDPKPFLNKLHGQQHLAERVDDMAVIRSCHGDMVVHSAAQYQLLTGRVIPGFPSMGSWVIYGLGSESDSLPAYVVMPDPKGALEAGTPMYANGFLPAVYQPTLFRPGDRPVLNLDLPKGISLTERRHTLGLLKQLNQLDMSPDDTEFSARLNAYDLAFKMQTEAPAIFDISNEPQETLDLYGIGKRPTDDYGRRCLLARRLVEKGVRFVCPVSGG